MLNRLDGKPTWLLTELHQRAARLLAEGFAHAGARGYHYRLLAALEQFGPTSQAELGRATGIDRSDIVAALNELAAAGYVQRSADTTDRRRNVITMTGRGANRLEELELVVAQAQTRLLAPLNRAERKDFLALMRAVLDGH